MSANSPQSPTPSTDGAIPSPLSSVDTAETQHSDMNPLPTPESKLSNMAVPLAPISSSPKRSVASTIRRNRSPPRNAANEMICDHPDCVNKQPQETFKRRCEYNKHMDRHERPYKCHEPGCELSLGFTYSGGLLRHQREVHKMHLSSNQPLFCPFPNCNRSNGAGFTRKENLEEHKRRRHLGELTRPSLSPSGQNVLLVAPTTASRKRKRLPTPLATEDEEGDGDFLTRHTATSDLEAHPTVKALRTLLAQKDEIIHWQQTEMQKLQNIITSLPQQALYNINAANIVGLGGTGGGVGPSVGGPNDDAHAAKMS